MSQQDQDRADFEAWHLKVRGHVNADNACRKYLQEKDWETWQAARLNQPLVHELTEALKVCKAALDWVVEQGGGPACEHEGGVVCFCKENNAINVANAAIAKATGSPE